MTKSISSICCLLVAVVATMPAAISAVSFRFSTASCRNGDDDPFTNVNITVSCDGNHNSSGCLFGDVASIEGTVEATRSFDDSAMEYKACVWKYCPQNTIHSAGTLCEDWLTPIEDQTCGDPGLYSISRTETIPEADVGNSLSWLVTVNVGVSDDTSCNHTRATATATAVTATAKTEVSPSYSSTNSEKSRSGEGRRRGGGESYMSYSLMGAIFGTAFGTVLATRKRCNEREEYDDDELFEERPFSFTELKDFACNA